MTAPAIRPAAPDDLDRLFAALAALAGDLGDPFQATRAGLAAACFGRVPAAVALLAERGEETVGACLVSPVFSTSWGSAGAYVSDLWVAPAERGSGLGRRLLAHAARLAAEDWGAGYVKLAVYEDNPRAAAFYARLGFAFQTRERTAILGGAALATLTGAIS